MGTPESIFGKIMLATDGSENSLHAAQRIAEIAKTHNSEVVILHVAESYYQHLKTPPGDRINITAREDIESEQTERGHANEIIAGTKKVFDDMSVKTSVKLIEGEDRHPTGRSIAKSIIDEGVKENVDLIVVGAHGHTNIKEWFRDLGSTAENVVRHAHCPVLIVR